MHLLPRERDKVFLHQVGTLAQKRLARGRKLNIAEATALIATVLQERIRDGEHSVAQLMQHGKTLLGRDHVLPGVPELLREAAVASVCLLAHSRSCTQTRSWSRAPSTTAPSWVRSQLSRRPRL
jgi:urease